MYPPIPEQVNLKLKSPMYKLRRIGDIIPPCLTPFVTQNLTEHVSPQRKNILWPEYQIASSLITNKGTPLLLLPLYRVCNITVIIICKFMFVFTTLNRGATWQSAQYSRDALHTVYYCWYIRLLRFRFAKKTLLTSFDIFLWLSWFKGI